MRKGRASNLTLGQYTRVRTSDENPNDGSALADHRELSPANERSNGAPEPHPVDELALDDPLSNGSAIQAHTTSAASPRWPQLTPRFNKNRMRLGPPTPLDFSDERDDEGTAGLLNDETNVAQVNGAAISPTWARAGKRTVGWLVWPLPSFTHRFFGVRYPDDPRRPTDYLDGLRGVASLFVFFSHYLLGVHDNFVHDGYGYSNNWNVFQLPFIRTIYAGSAMVAIFFVISGFVLSQRCVIAMRNRQHDKLYTALTSMTFRRGVRLFLPSLAIMLVTFSLVLLGILTPEYPDGWTWGVEFGTLRWHIFEDLLNLWYWEVWIDNWYAPQLWTIPVEYRCSMLLFVLILMVARTKQVARWAIEGITLVYLFYATRWDAALFVAGLILSELRLAVDAKQELEREARGGADDAGPDHNWQGTQERWYHVRKSHIPLWILLVIGLYLTGYPDHHADNTPGYDFLTKIWNGDNDTTFRFWVAQSAIFFVGAVTFLPKAQAFFSTPIARYLGKISYALYLVHQLMNRTIRVALWSIFWNVLHYEKDDGKQGVRFEGGWILGGIVYVPLVIWAADVFWRAVDIPTVKVAKWIEVKCSIRENT